MTFFAIHDNAHIVNVIVADTQEVAEQVTGLSAIETTGSPWIGWTLESEGWRPPAPFSSWVWGGSEWEAPVPMPADGDWYWDEDTLSWVEVIP